jgi:hypothetical protein
MFPDERGGGVRETLQAARRNPNGSLNISYFDRRRRAMSHSRRAFNDFSSA